MTFAPSASDVPRRRARAAGAPPLEALGPFGSGCSGRRSRRLGTASTRALPERRARAHPTPRALGPFGGGGGVSCVEPCSEAAWRAPLGVCLEGAVPGLRHSGSAFFPSLETGRMHTACCSANPESRTPFWFGVFFAESELLPDPSPWSPSAVPVCVKLRLLIHGHVLNLSGTVPRRNCSANAAASAVLDKRT